MATKRVKRGAEGPWEVMPNELYRRVAQSLKHIEDELGIVRRALESAQKQGAGVKMIRIPKGPPLVGVGCQIVEYVKLPTPPGLGPKANKNFKPRG